MNKRLFNPGRKRKATLKDVAGRLGLSVSVVSRALSRRPDKNARVAPHTVRKIAAAAKILNFHPNRAAEFIKRGALPTIGVFVSATPNQLIADLLFGISESAQEEGFPLQIDGDFSVKGFRRFMRHNLDLAHSGVISYPMLITQPQIAREVERFRMGGGKIVLLNCALEIPGVPVVAMDERLGGRLAAERLLARRCKAFAVAGKFKERGPGFAEKLAEAGRSADFFSKDETGLRKLIKFCKASARPAGIFAVYDILALAVIRLLRQAGLNPGHDVLVVGYDNMKLGEVTDPPLTTIHQPFREEGRLAARKLINLIYGVEEKSILLSPRLVARESG
jgi:LacI family transcriptional regulator